MPDGQTLSIAQAAHWQKFYRQELEDQMKPGALELLWNKERRERWRRSVGLDAPRSRDRISSREVVTIPIHRRPKDTA